MLHRILYIDHTLYSTFYVVHTIHIIPHILGYAYYIILDYTNHTIIYYTYYHVHTLHLALYILHYTYCMPACELEYIKYCTYYTVHVTQNTVHRSSTIQRILCCKYYPYHTAHTRHYKPVYILHIPYTLHIWAHTVFLHTRFYKDWTLHILYILYYIEVLYLLMYKTCTVHSILYTLYLTPFLCISY